jgi:hypothetical protein
MQQTSSQGPVPQAVPRTVPITVSRDGRRQRPCQGVEGARIRVQHGGACLKHWVAGKLLLIPQL